MEKLKAFNNKKIIVPLGNAGLYTFHKEWPIAQWRGSLLWNEELDCKFMPTFAINQVIRDHVARRLVIHDLKRAKAHSANKQLVKPERKYILQPEYEQVMEYLQDLLDNANYTSYDIEVLRGEVSHISFSKNHREAISIDLLRNNRNTYDVVRESNIMTMIGRILQSPDIEIGGANLEFDNRFMFEHYGIITNNYFDIAIGHKICYPDMKANLALMTSVLTEEQYYKEEGKSYMFIGGDERDFCLYSARDSVVVSEIKPQVAHDLNTLNNQGTFEAQNSLIDPVIYMATRGIKTNVEGMEAFRASIRTEIEELSEELNTLCGTEINVKGDSLKHYFYKTLGLKPYINRKTKAQSLDEDALIRLKRRGFKEADLALQIRKRRTLDERYLNIKYKDGRLVCSYNPIGAGTGRLSSSKQIVTGFGGNSQNIPHTLDKYFLADDGYLIGNVDYSQADNRTVAYVAPEPRMIDAFESGTDIHSLTASMIFELPIDEIIAMDEEGVKAQIGTGDRTHRKWSKECNHSLNFGLGYRSFAQRIEVDERTGKMLHGKYHKIYPNIQGSYHNWVESEISDRRLTNPFGRTYLFLKGWGIELFHQAYAFIPQSTTADAINRYGLIPFYYDQTKYRELELLRQVHDSINFQIPISVGVPRIVQILKDMKDELEQPIKFKSREWSLPADFSLGHTLGMQKNLNFEDNLEEVVQNIIDKTYWKEAV